MATISASDQKKIEEYQEAWKNATTDEERAAAHEGAEAIRAQYGYSGGDDGSEYIPATSGGSTYAPGTPTVNDRNDHLYPSLESYSDPNTYYNSGVIRAPGNDVQPSVVTSTPEVLARRNQALAGQVVSINGYSVYYDNLGYVEKMVKNVGADNAVIDAQRLPAGRDITAVYGATDRSQYGGNDTDKYYFSDSELAQADYWRQQAAAGNISWEQANQMVNEIRRQYGYTADSTGSQIIPAGIGQQTAAGMQILPGSTQGSAVYGGGSGASGGGSSGYDLSEYLRQQQAALTEAELARLKGAYETSMRGYDDTAERLPEPYIEARNNLAAQNDIAQRNFDERAVAAGLSSGTAGQAMLSRQNAYVSGLAGIDNEQANAQAALDLQKANLQTAYETAIAEAQNSGDAELASALYQELIRVQNLERNDAEIARSEAQRAQELALQYGLADPTGIAQIQSMSDLSAMRSGYAADASDLTATGTTTGNSIINNEGLDDAKVKAVQQALGVSVDGKSGDKTRAAVKAAGYSSLTDAYNKLFGVTKDPTATLPGGYTATQAWQETIANAHTDTDMLNYLNKLYQEGKITEAMRNSLASAVVNKNR